MTIATPQDVQTSLMRTLTETETEYVEPLLERAERLILARIPDLATRAASDTAFRLALADIEAESVARVFRAGPDGVFRTETEGNYTYQLNLSVASGLLDILPAEWARLFGGGGWGALAPATDGYLAGRYSYGRVDPAHWFQYGWGGGDQLSDVVAWGWPV